MSRNGVRWTAGHGYPGADWCELEALRAVCLPLMLPPTAALSLVLKLVPAGNIGGGGDGRRTLWEGGLEKSACGFFKDCLAVSVSFATSLNVLSIRASRPLK